MATTTTARRHKEHRGAQPKPSRAGGAIASTRSRGGRRTITASPVHHGGQGVTGARRSHGDRTLAPGENEDGERLEARHSNRVGRGCRSSRGEALATGGDSRDGRSRPEQSGDAGGDRGVAAEATREREGARCVTGSVDPGDRPGWSSPTLGWAGYWAWPRLPLAKLSKTPAVA